jgi:glycosyltransferase involved in cell wall biosynthesis
LKVLHVLTDNRLCGPQIYVVTIAKALRQFGIETIVVAPKGQDGFAQWAAKEHFKAYQIDLDHPRYLTDLISFLLNLRWLLRFPFSVFTITKIIKRESIDIVYLQGLWDLQASIAAWFTRRKIVWYLDGTAYPRILVWALMPFVKLVSSRMVIEAVKMAEFYFGQQKDLAKSVVRLIYEGIDTNKFHQDNILEAERTKLKVEFGLGYHDKVIGCIANINPDKGYEYLIQAAHLVKTEVNTAKFLIVGAKLDTQKAYTRKLENLVSSLGMEQDVIFAGSRSDTPQILSIFDVFVLSSVAEGIPLALLEAMAMERPVVATDVGAISEAILNGETGIIAPPKDPESIAEAVIYLLESSQVAIEMGKKARQKVMEMFSLEKCAESNNKMLKEMMSKENFYKV